MTRKKEAVLTDVDELFTTPPPPLPEEVPNIPSSLAI